MSTRQDLWAFLNDHGATLLESEISEVIDLAAAASEQARLELDNANIKLTAALNRVWALVYSSDQQWTTPNEVASHMQEYLGEQYKEINDLRMRNKGLYLDNKPLKAEIERLRDAAKWMMESLPEAGL